MLALSTFTKLFSNKKARPSDGELRAVENKIGNKLPDAYKKFLKESGDIGKQNELMVEVSSPVQPDQTLYTFVIAKFLHICPNTPFDLFSFWQNKKDKLPENFLPIAIDKFNNFLCLNLLNGTIHFVQISPINMVLTVVSDKNKRENKSNDHVVASNFLDFQRKMVRYKTFQ